MKEENIKGEYQRKVDKSLIPTCNIMGVNIAAINMNWLLKYLDENLSDIKGDYICVSNVHTTVTSYEDAAYCAVQNGGLMAIPDGGPLSSVGRKRGYSDMDRTTGPSLMGEIFKISAEKGYRHYFYGSTEETLKLLEEKLQENYPGIQIAGMYSPPFRPLTEEEDKNSKEMKQALENKTCTFYHKGYWYWISQDNYLKKSNLRGNKAVVFYAPRSGNYIGWIRQYNNRIILSLNSGIYRMSFLNKYPVLLKKVDNRDKNAETKGALWSLIYIGRFIVNKNGWLSYYTTDFHGVRRGNVKIFLGRAQQSGQLTKSGRKIIQLQAGQIKQLATIHMHDRGLRTAGWTSANPSIVSIDNNGYMKAKRSGKTYISTRINGRKRAFRVKVSGYTITYKNVGINSSKNRERLSGKRAVTLRSPRKKGYTFVGWYDSSGKNVTVIPKGNTKNLILHAKWDKTSSKDSVKAK